MKNIYFADFSCTHGRMCVYGRYAPEFIILLTISYRALNTVQVLWLRIPTLCTYVSSQRHISVEIHVTQVPVKPLEVISYTGYPGKSQNGWEKENCSKRFLMVYEVTLVHHHDVDNHRSSTPRLTDNCLVRMGLFSISVFPSFFFQFPWCLPFHQTKTWSLVYQ